MALQTKAAMLPHSALNAWSDALYYHVKYKSTQVNFIVVWIKIMKPI